MPRRGIFNREESGITESYCRNPRWVSLSFIRNSTALFYRNFRASYRKIPRPYKYRIPFRGRYKTPCLPSACNPPQASFPRSAYRMNLHIPNFHNLFVGITSSFSVVFPSVTQNTEKRAQTFCLRPPFDCHPLSAYTFLPRFAATRQFQIIPLSFASFSASVPLIFEVTSFNRIFSFIESFMLEIGCLSSA